jgi:hypothetical protein
MTMTSLEIAFVVLLVVFGGAVLGLLIGRRLPPHHMSSETKAVVSVSMAVVGTMSALVIGLLISNASSSFTARNRDLGQLSADIMRLDALLRRYGPEANAIRDVLQRYTTLKFEDLFPNRSDGKAKVDNPATAKVLDDVQDLILALRPGDDRQRWLSSQALQLAADVGEARWLLVRRNMGAVPLPFLGAVTLWLTVLFASFGLFARNVTAIIALFLCAFAVSAAIKLILDLDTPFEGRIRLSRPPIHISSEPMRDAIEAIRH